MKKIFILMMVACFMVVGNTFAAEYGDIKIHGFISQGYLKSDENNFLAETEDGSFKFNEMGINFVTWLQPGLRAGVQLFSRRLGSDDGEIIVDWAVGDYTFKEWLGVRAGRMKIDSGFYSQVRDIDMMRTSILLPQSVYAEIWRDSLTSLDGFGVYGTIPMSVMGDLSYNYQIGSGTFDEEGGFATSSIATMERAGYIVDIESFDADYIYVIGGKWATPLPGMNIGFTFKELVGLEIAGNMVVATFPVLVTTPYYNDDVKIMDRTWSIDYMISDFYFIAEYYDADIRATFNVPAGSVQETSGGGTKGWYVFGSWRVVDFFEWGLGYSEYYPDTNDKDGSDVPAGYPDFINWLKDAYLSLRFDVKTNWIVKLEYHDMNGFGAYTTATNDPAELEEDWYLTAFKVTYSF